MLEKNPTLHQVRQWEPWRIREVGEGIRDLNVEYQQYIEAMVAQIKAAGSHWSGDAYYAAYDRVAGDRDNGKKVAQSIEHLAAELINCGAQLTDHRSVLLGKVDEAEGVGLRVSDEWLVSSYASSNDELLVHAHQSGITIALNEMLGVQSQSVTSIEQAYAEVQARGARLGPGDPTDAGDSSAILYGVPSSPGGYGSYERSYPFSAPAGYTSETLMAEIAENFDKYFPFTGCGPSIRSGKVCSLEAIPGADVPQPIRINHVGSDGIVIESLPGHVEGAGRTITFQARPTTGNVWELHIEAWGPVKGVSGVPGAGELSANIWQGFAQNLTDRLPSAPNATA